MDEGCYLTRKPGTPIPVSSLLVGEKITIRARIKPLGSSRILLRDPTGERIVKLAGGKALEILSLPCETLVEITGVVNGEELTVDDYSILHKPLKPEVLCVDRIPEDPVEYTRKYHVYARHPDILRAVKTYSVVLKSSRSLLDKQGFTELPAPIIGYASDPGLRGAIKATLPLYGGVYEIQSSVIMYKQLYSSLLGKIYYVARNLRIEPPENAGTGRHLVEFTQLDVEASLSTASEMMKLAEEVVYKIVKHILDDYYELLTPKQASFLEKAVPKPPYPRVDYDSAVELLERKGCRVEHGRELSFNAEALLGEIYGTPVWVHGFPASSRGFYYVEDPGKPGYNVDYNLIMPGRSGEILDGGCREYRYEKLVEKIKRHGEPLEKYKWFLDLAEAGGIQPSCGWGLGLERLVKFIQGLQHVAYATPHPRIPGVIGP
ncbi:MAG: asparagine synthetase A [Desulfurococcus sp.]|nr:asparagine synthetase A [Desulfurococcus sp.]